MQLLKKIFLLASFTTTLLALEYVYPVKTNSQSVFYIYQKSLSDLELWRYDIHGQEPQITKLLYWRFLPANFKLLPDNKSFSFIDSDRLQVKQFIKRSPVVVEFEMPVFGLTEINWLDSTTCYFSAKQNQHFVIFKVSIDSGRMEILANEPDIDCLCPRLIDDQLFFIARHDGDRSSSIVIKNGLSKDGLSKDGIIDCGYQQIIHLQMLSQSLGFYIEHMPYIDENSNLITLICHKIELRNKSWKNIKLFKFHIPKAYILGEQRLYESVAPFLPRAYQDILYFSDINSNQLKQFQSSLFSYDLLSNKTTQILNSCPGQVFFAPVICGDKLFYGQVLPAVNQENDFSLSKILSLKIT